MVDRRPLNNRDITLDSRESPLLAAAANLHYASTHGYAFLFANYSHSALEGRHYGWSKVAVLHELMSFHREIEFVVFLDGDATFRANLQQPLHELPELQEFFAQRTKLFFFARDPKGNNPYKSQQWNGQQNLINNTDHTCGFFIVRNTLEALQRVREWWNVPVRLKQMEKYKYLWPHCQRCWDDVMRPRYPQLWSQSSIKAFNTPDGKYVQHVWYKNKRAFVAPWKRELLNIMNNSKVSWMHNGIGEAGSFPAWYGTATSLEADNAARLVRYQKTVIPLDPSPRGRAAKFALEAAPHMYTRLLNA